MKIGYLASHYPAVSHTFVLREIQALRRVGVDVETFSIHRASHADLLAPADREEAQRTYAVLPVRPGDFVCAHATALIRAPRRYLSTLAFAVRRANPGLRGRLWGLFYFAEAIPIWRAAKRRGVHHLHAVFADVASDAALLVARYGGEGWTWSLGAHGPSDFQDVSASHLAEKIASARFLTAISDFGRSQLMAFGTEDRWPDIHVVHCGIEPTAFPVGQIRPISDSPHILSVGRLVHLKGQTLLIEAFAELFGRGLAAKLTLVGDGPERTELEQLAQRLGVGDQVTFTGAVGQDRIQQIYRSADVFCLPSMAEGVPVVLMEAMALQVPVVATRIMGVGELVEDGHTGLLVPPGRRDVLVAAFERLFGDPALYTHLAREGRNKVLAEFDVNASALRLRDVLMSALGPAAQA